MFAYVTLYFTVGPLDVELIGRKDPVSVGRLYEFRCQSVGARPPPHVTWWRGSIQLRENVTSRVSKIIVIGIGYLPENRVFFPYFCLRFFLYFDEFSKFSNVF